MKGTDTLVVQGIVDRAKAWQERVYAYERSGCSLTVFEEEALVLLAQFRLVTQYDAWAEEEHFQGRMRLDE